MNQTDRVGSYDEWVGRDAFDRHGNKLGEIKDIFYDDVTQRPEWVAVKAGAFKGQRLVPLAGAALHGDDGNLMLNFDKERIIDAPNFDEDQHLSPEQEQRLYQHYGYDWASRGKDHGYGTSFTDQRFDKDYDRSKMGAIGAVGTERTHERTEEVPVKGIVEVPVDTTVRLRRWETQKQSTRTVQVPVTETEEHVEVVGQEGKVARDHRS